MEGKRLDDQREVGWEVGEKPRLSLSVGYEKVANIVLRSLREHSSHANRGPRGRA